MSISDRYASAVRSANLKSRAETTQSDSDVLGAYGIAAKPVLANGRPGAPLAIALARLFAGDNHAAAEIVALMAENGRTRAQGQKIVLKRTESVDIARAVLAWHRDGACRPCNGLGYLIVPGSPHLSSNACPKCRSTGKQPFEKAFKPQHQPIATWLLIELDRELGRAGPAAMAALAPRLEL